MVVERDHLWAPDYEQVGHSTDLLEVEAAAAGRNVWKNPPRGVAVAEEEDAGAAAVVFGCIHHRCYCYCFSVVLGRDPLAAAVAGCMIDDHDKDMFQ